MWMLDVGDLPPKCCPHVEMLISEIGPKCCAHVESRTRLFRRGTPACNSGLWGAGYCEFRTVYRKPSVSESNRARLLKTYIQPTSPLLPQTIVQLQACTERDDSEMCVAVHTCTPRAALNVVPHVVFRRPKCWNMLDVVCSPKCCFNMWNIWGGPYSCLISHHLSHTGR